MTRGASRQRWPGWAHRPISNFKVSLPRGLCCLLVPVGSGRGGAGRRLTWEEKNLFVPKGMTVLFLAQPNTLGGCFGGGLVCLEDIGEFGHLGLGDQKTGWRRIVQAF